MLYVGELRMPEIHIAYDLPSFKDAFVWEATEAELVRLLQSQRDAATRTV